MRIPLKCLRRAPFPCITMRQFNTIYARPHIVLQEPLNPILNNIEMVLDDIYRNHIGFIIYDTITEHNIFIHPIKCEPRLLEDAWEKL